MGKLATQSPAAETIGRTTDKPNGDLYFELHYADTVAHKIEMTPLYDDEIGLWEELEHRQGFCYDAIK